MRYTTVQKEKIFAKTSGKCHLCHKKLARKNYGVVGRRGAWEIDHSKARADQGSDHMNNLFAACISCNRKKQAKPTRVVRAVNNVKRAPLSRDQRAKAKRDGAFQGGAIGFLVGLVGGPVGMVVGTAIGAAIGYDQEPDQ